MTKDSIVMCINQYGLSHRSEELESLIAPSIRIKPHPAKEDGLPVGASKFGGHPDLPPDLKWPERNGRLLSLIAQLNLREIAAIVPISAPPRQLKLLDVEPEPVESPLLPSSGLLYFFYDVRKLPWGGKPEHRDGWQVIYCPNEVNLHRSYPPTASSTNGDLPACRLEFTQEAMLPDRDALSIELLNLSREEEEIYWELRQGDYTWSETRHRLLGYPQAIQNPMEEDCALLVHGLTPNDAEAELHKEEGKNWRLLLQVDSDDNAKMSWLDGGHLYFWIRNTDLQARFFDNVWMMLQCH